MAQAIGQHNRTRLEAGETLPHDDRVNDWPRTRNSWTLLFVFWGITLAVALLGTAVAPLFVPSSTSFAAQLPWVMGGSLFASLGGTIGTVLRRRWQTPISGAIRDHGTPASQQQN
jgi:hypothetical protein